MNNYTVLHLHSDLSNGVTNIDSVTKYDDYINRAKELGMTALAFSEHGSVFGWRNKKLHIEKAGMKYIHAEEFYITETIEDKIKDNYHCLLIAKDYDGFLELNTLSSKAFNRQDGHYYYVPRITFDELINTSEHIIILTACLGGILAKGEGKIKEDFINFLRLNSNRCFLEIQHHNVDAQKEYNKFLLMLSETINVALIATTDTHALNQSHLEGRAILQKAKNINFDDEWGWDLTFKSYDELVDAFKQQGVLPENKILEAIENTNKVADMVEEFTISEEYKYPHLWEDSMGTFRDKINKGIITRGVDKFPNYQEYLDRIEYEIEAYVHNGAIDFMLLMEDIVAWCRTQDIKIGYGRGSVNGSVIAWLLGITEMDSIKHGLNFERFMNVERVSLSDIDTDFPPSRINEVKNYICSKPGLYCSDIITFNTIADKGAIRDVGRALGMSLDLVGDICDSVDDEKAYIKSKEKYSELFKYVEMVKGTIVSIGSHPCGLIVSPQSLEDNIGLCTTSTSDYPISQIYMKEVDGLNYVKLDLLKLDTIELIDRTCKLAGIPMFTPDNIDIEDVNVWNSIRDNTTAIFQWEGNTGNDYIKKLMADENIKKFQKVNKNVDRMTLLSIGNSAIRPAGASYREDLANGVIRTTGSKPIDEFLQTTFGYLVFQCQIIEFLNKYCGFTMGEADIVRRGFAKKTGTEQFIPIIKNGGYLNDKHYIAGFIATMQEKYNIPKEKSEQDIVAFIQVIKSASEYLFSLNHSAAYSFEGYVSGYLRYYYPVEFLTSALNIATDKEEKTRALIEYANFRGITIRSPKFRYSKADYFCDVENKIIYKGTGSIKFMNNEIADILYEYFKNKHYTNFVDLLYDIKELTTINSRQLDILIKINYFEEFGDINKLLNIVSYFEKIYDKKNINNEKAESLGLTREEVIPFAQKVTDKQCSNVDMRALLKYIYNNKEVSPINLSQKIKYQLEHLGYIDYLDPNVDKRYVVVTELDTTYSPKFKGYCLNNGKVCELKVHKKKNPREKEVKVSFANCPFENGDILYMTTCDKKPKQKKTDTGWKVIPNEFNWFINDYKIVTNL